MTAEEKVKAVYPDAFVLREKTYNRADLFTCLARGGLMMLGPTAFTEEAAWKYAAERIE